MDGSALAILVFSLAATVAAVALPPSYPNAPIELWRSLFWLGIVGMIVSAAYMIRVNMNWSKIGPVALIGLGAGLVFIGIGWYWGQSSSHTDATVSAPELTPPEPSTPPPNNNLGPSAQAAPGKADDLHSREPPTTPALEPTAPAPVIPPPTLFRNGPNATFEGSQLICNTTTGGGTIIDNQGHVKDSQIEGNSATGAPSTDPACAKPATPPPQPTQATLPKTPKTTSK